MNEENQSLDHVSVPVPPEGATTGEKFERLVKIIAALRGPNGCPWDKSQTHQSIGRNVVEESYEALQAIEDNDLTDMCEELGDVLMQVVLQSQIAVDQGEFCIDDVIDGISKKMVSRHPHVFGTDASFEAAGFTQEDIDQINSVQTADDVLPLWDAIKVREKQKKAQAKEQAAIARGEKPRPKSMLDDVSKSQPSLMQAQDISRKAVSYGFEWETVDDVWDKVYEEIGEYKQAIKVAGDSTEAADADAAELEFGDILFSLVNVARKDGIDAETALRKTCDKFRRRWSCMEEQATRENRTLDSYDIDGLDALWGQAKKQLGEH